MVTSLVSPAVKDVEREPNIDAPCPRREPRPSKKKLEDLENSQRCEDLKRKKTRKEPGAEKGQNLKEPSSKQKQMNKEPEVSRKKKSVSKRGKAADPKDTQDRGFISAANTQRVQNLLEHRQHASWKPEVVEIDEGAEDKTNQSTSSVQPKSKPQPSGMHVHVAQSAVPAEPVQISSEPQPHPINVVKSTASVSNSRLQQADTFQQRDIPSLMHQLSVDKQPDGSESTFVPSQQSSYLSIGIQSSPLHLITNQLHLSIQPQDFSSLQHHWVHLFPLQDVLHQAILPCPVLNSS